MRSFSLFLPLLFLIACASTPQTADNPLAGTNWELRAIVDGSDSLTTLPRDGLVFSDTSINIRSCNICNGLYIVDGERFITSNMRCTMRACAQTRPELASIIGDSASFRLQGESLIIEASSRRLYFVAMAPEEGN